MLHLFYDGQCTEETRCLSVIPLVVNIMEVTGIVQAVEK